MRPSRPTSSTSARVKTPSPEPRSAHAPPRSGIASRISATASGVLTDSVDLTGRTWENAAGATDRHPSRARLQWPWVQVQGRTGGPDLTRTTLLESRDGAPD